MKDLDRLGRVLPLEEDLDRDIEFSPSVFADFERRFG